MAKYTLPGPGSEYAAGKPPLSVPVAGVTTVTNAPNPVTGRFDVFRDGVRIAVCKTQSHANEISAHAAGVYPNPNPATLRNQITSFEPPPGS